MWKEKKKRGTEAKNLKCLCYHQSWVKKSNPGSHKKKKHHFISYQPSIKPKRFFLCGLAECWLRIEKGLKYKKEKEEDIKGERCRGRESWDGLVLNYRVEEEYQEVRRGHTGRKMNFMSKQMAALPLDDKAPYALRDTSTKRDSSCTEKNATRHKVEKAHIPTQLFLIYF